MHVRTGLRVVGMAALLVSGALPSFCLAQGPSFERLGQLPGYPTGTSAVAVSADGSIVVGTAGADTPTSEGWKWTAATGLVGLGRVLGEQANGVVDLSADGSVIFGFTSRYVFAYWVKWAGGDRTEFGPWSPGSSSNTWPQAISPDGKTFGGGRYVLRDGEWIDIKQLGCFGDVVSMEVRDFSTDGSSVLMGINCTPFILRFADQTAVSLMQIKNATAGSMTPDGRFVASTVKRWQEGVGVDHVFYPVSYVEDISSDGATVVGHQGISKPAVWHVNAGARCVDGMLSQFGLDLTGWTLKTCVGVSADGRTLVGTGVNPDGVREAWIAKVPFVPPSPDFNEDAFVDAIDFDQFLANWISGAPPADVNRDDFVDAIDFDLFVAAFRIGC